VQKIICADTLIVDTNLAGAYNTNAYVGLSPDFMAPLQIPLLL